MTINKGSIAWLCFAWGFGLLLGLTFSLNIPLVLFLIGTVLMLVNW